MREATSTRDVPWLISSKVFDEDFLDLMEQSEALLESTNVDDLVAHAATGLPPELHEVGALMGAAFQVAVALRLALPPTPNGSPRDDVPSVGPTTVEEMVSDTEIPRPIRDAIYGGYESIVCTVALLDPRPIPDWLHDELLRRALIGQRDSLRVLLAIARREGIESPSSPVLESVVPLDFDVVEREHKEQRSALERGLAASRRQSDHQKGHHGDRQEDQ